MRHRRWFYRFVLTGIILVATACGSHTSNTPTAQAGQPVSLTATPSENVPKAHSTEEHITVDGVDRTYFLYRPAGLTGSAPLVVMLHGGFGSAEGAEQSYGWDSEADRGHFVVAYPDGLDHFWNAGGGCCGQPARQNVDDVAFITQMVTRIEQTIPIDRQRIYATGMSNGAIMTYRLACDTGIFAAIAPVSGTLLGDCPDPKPLSVIHIHGLDDQTILYNGGTGSGRGHITDLPVPQVIAKWRQVDGCSPPTSTTAGSVTTSTADCPNGHAVELITVASAGHQWPGSPPKPLKQRVLGTDPPSNALSATDTIWRFFVAHPKA